MLSELGRRGRGVVESGAFLLSPAADASGHVTHVVYYDDLDPDCLQGGISLHGFAYSKLWDICSEHGLKLIGDVHTHPSTGVKQSSIDRAHPMHSQTGHIALILPTFATAPVRATEVGVHEYLGDKGWRSHFGRDAARLLYIARHA